MPFLTYQITWQTRRNVLDVSYHVSQYQAIITELKGEISRLNEKLNSDDDPEHNITRNSTKTKQLKKDLIEMFREQMNLRSKLMEIDNTVLSLSMEFERQNQVVQEWEAERLRRSRKPTRRSDRELTIDMDNESNRGELSFICQSSNLNVLLYVLQLIITYIIICIFSSYLDRKIMFWLQGLCWPVFCQPHA